MGVCVQLLSWQDLRVIRVEKRFAYLQPITTIVNENKDLFVTGCLRSSCCYDKHKKPVQNCTGFSRFSGVELGNRMADDFTLVQVNDIFGDIGCQVGDALQVSGNGQVIEDCIDTFRMFTDVIFK